MPAIALIPREVDRAFLLIGGTCVLLLVGITVAMVVFVIRYRRGKARTTSQVEGHLWLEITWTVIPTLIVTWMFFVGYEGFGLMRRVPPDAMVVQVTGRQWSWSFHYPGAGIDSTEMVVPVDQTVKVELTAPPTDVTHSFYIPDFRVKEDVVPGRTTYLWFKAERTGTYDVFCSEFCGKDHSKMLSRMRVLAREDFARWLATEQGKRYQPLVFEAIANPNHETFGPAGINVDTSSLYLTYCASCHGVNGDGSGLPGEARDFTTPADWKRSPKVTDIYRILADGVPGTQMRSFPNLSPWEKVASAHYVRHFLKTDAPTDTREDYDALVKQYGLDKIQPPKPALPIDEAMRLLVEKKQAPASAAAP